MSWILRRTAIPRARAKAVLARRVQSLVFPPEYAFPGDARRREVVPHTTHAPVRLVAFGPTDGEPVQIGAWCGIHHTVTMIQGGMHHIENVATQPFVLTADGRPTIPIEQIYSKGPIVIGSDVWIGIEAMVMSGISIGHGAVVAARAVVTRDVEPFEVVGGNPLKHIRYRFDEDTRAALLRIAWWDWPVDRVQAARPELDSPDLAAFIAKYDPGA